MEDLDFSIILPAYNESENLPDVLRSLKQVLNKAEIKSEIVVVDNGSTDNTEEVLGLLKKEINELKTLRIEKNIGFGNGIIKGLKVGRGSILGFTHADGQIKGEDLVKVYLKLKNNSFDLCKGFRVNRSEGFWRRILSRSYNFLFRIMFNCSYQDINGAPKIFTREFYEKVYLQSKDGFIDPEILLKAKQYNYSVGEVPITFLERKGGKSSVSILTAFAFLRGMAYWFFFRKF